MKKFENKILDNLYEIKEGEVEKKYILKQGRQKDNERTEKLEEELVNFTKNFIKEEKGIKELCNRINTYKQAIIDRMNFWNRLYYKEGFIDAMSLKQQIKKEGMTDSNFEESIIYKNMKEISDLFEEQKYNNLQGNEDYIENVKRIEKIKAKFPKVRDFFENGKIAEFSKQEMKEILNIVYLHSDIATYEECEMFKIGLREGKAL